MTSVLQLQCDCNNYPWGKQGHSSLAARYAASTPGTTFKIDPSKHYSEMWIGTYPSYPSLVLSTGEELQSHISANKDTLVGPEVLEKFGADLPFLPKILSISKTLPLQIHPDKELATKLHKHNPSKFGDPNHKPEIAVALGDFEAFAGFKHVSGIKTLFRSVPILREYFPTKPETPFTNTTLKNIVHKLLSLSKDEVAEIYIALRDTPLALYGDQSYILRLLPRLADEHGIADPSTLVSLLTMNFMTLKKDEALYIPADGIHSYLSGDIVECMARSDNIIKSGFCPSGDRDSIDLFTSALTYDYKDPRSMVLKPRVSTKGLKCHTRMYEPPNSEFDMLIIDLTRGEEEHIVGLQGPGIAVVTKGSGRLHTKDQDLVLKEGYTFFVGYDTDLRPIADNDENLEIHLAFCEA